MAMIALMFGLTLGVLEIGLSVYYTDRQSTNWSRFDPVRGWSLIPGQYWVKPLHRLTSFPLVVNNIGLRAHNLPPKVDRKERLIVLGDSFTFAKETQTEKIFTEQLQTVLDDRHPGVEVLNAGVPGYGTAQ